MKYYYAYVYITTNPRNTTLYIGVTNELRIRMAEHRGRVDKKSFVSRYNCVKLVYWEGFDSIKDAIKREKQLKAGSRKKKIDLINKMNPEWKDLYDGLSK